MRIILRLKTGASVYDYQFLLCDNEEDLARSTLYGVIIPIAAFYLLKGVFRHACERFMSLFEDHSEERQVFKYRLIWVENRSSTYRTTNLFSLYFLSKVHLCMIVYESHAFR